MSCSKTSNERSKEMAVTSSNRARVTLPTDEQILITREFDAPRNLVYKAYTTPDLVRRWWHANRGEVTLIEIDLRVGGTWRYVMKACGGPRGRLPRRVPRDRPGRTNRLDGGLRGRARGRGVVHGHLHRDRRAHHARDPRAAFLPGDTAMRTSTPAWRTACRMPCNCSSRSRTRFADPCQWRR